MGINVSWHNDQMVAILQDFHPGWTWRDFDSSHRIICAMARQVDHPVTMIVNLSAAPNLPDGAILPHLQYFWNMKPSNLNRFIVVGPSRFMQMMGQIFARIVMGDVLTFVETMGEVEPILTQAQMAQPHSVL